MGGGRGIILGFRLARWGSPHYTLGYENPLLRSFLHC